MGKALIIKGADFSDCCLGHVEVTDRPCTGLQLSASSLTFTSDEKQTLTATVTPSNTTDKVTWKTSSSAVATVSGGVVTPVASGSATITATCGSYTATCSVTVNINEYVYSIGYLFEGGQKKVGLNTKRMMVSARTGTTALNNYDTVTDTFYPIMIPSSATTVAITMPGFKCGFLFLSDVKTVTLDTGTDSSVGYREYTIPDGATMLVINMRSESEGVISTDTDTSGFSVVFS